MTGPSLQDLVVAPEHETVEPLNWEGAGVVSSWADLGEAVIAPNPDPDQIAFAAAGAGLDTLGFIDDPFRALVGSAVGWLIEHVSFLHEPLDALAGDPTQIIAHAQTWHNVSKELAAVAADYRHQTADLSAWEGLAGDTYRAAAGGYTGALDTGSAGAEMLSGLVLTTGAVVGTVRALIRDIIADFIAKVIGWALGAAVTAWLTAGGSLAALAATVALRAADLAADFARRISDLLDALSCAGGVAGRIADQMRGLRTTLAEAGPGLRAGVEATIGNDDLATFVEAGKQLTGAQQDRLEWDR